MSVAVLWTDCCRCCCCCMQAQVSRILAFMQEYCLILHQTEKTSYMISKQGSVTIMLGTTKHMTAKVSISWSKPWPIHHSLPKLQSLPLSSESYFRYKSLGEPELFKGNSSLIPIHHHSIMSCCSYWHILSNPIPQYDCITNKDRKTTTKFKDCTEDAQGKKIPIIKQTKKGHTLSGNTNFYFALKVASFNKWKK